MKILKIIVNKCEISLDIPKRVQKFEGCLRKMTSLFSSLVSSYSYILLSRSHFKPMRRSLNRTWITRRLREIAIIPAFSLEHDGKADACYEPGEFFLSKIRVLSVTVTALMFRSSAA